MRLRMSRSLRPRSAHWSNSEKEISRGLRELRGGPRYHLYSYSGATYSAPIRVIRVIRGYFFLTITPRDSGPRELEPDLLAFF